MFIKILAYSGLSVLFGIPLISNIIGYSRDAIRLYDLGQFQTAFTFYKTDKGDSIYPKGFNTLLESKTLTKSPADPSEQNTSKGINNLFKLVGLSSVLNGTDINKEHGFFYQYETSKDNTEFKVSTKFESLFFKDKMIQDGGMENSRYELGTDLTLNPGLIDYSYNYTPDYYLNYKKTKGTSIEQKAPNPGINNELDIYLKTLNLKK